MTNVPFSLIKKKYASVAAAITASSTTQGVIVFDKKNKVICVDGDVYGGNIQDVNYDQDNNQLVITKADGTQQTLDFSDVASASSTMAVFGQLRDTIGVTDAVQHVQGHYTNTNYLQGAQTLIDADKILDTQIHTVQGHVQGVQGAVEAVQGEASAFDRPFRRCGRALGDARVCGPGLRSRFHAGSDAHTVRVARHTRLQPRHGVFEVLS